MVTIGTANQSPQLPKVQRQLNPDYNGFSNANLPAADRTDVTGNTTSKSSLGSAPVKSCSQLRTSFNMKVRQSRTTSQTNPLRW